MLDLAGHFQSRVILGSMQGRWEDAVSRDQAVGWLAEALEDLGAHAATRGVTLLYEHLNRYETNLFNRVEQVVPFLNSLRTRNVRMLADLFHLNIEERSVPEALRSCGELLGHIHFVDSNRRAAGWGHTDFAPVLAALREMRYAGYLSAECFAFPDSDAAAAQTIARFRELIGPRPSPPGT
jgi:sugar phosphate isomerase/epimerase